MTLDTALAERHLDAEQRLKAAHARLERECVRTASMPGADTVSLSVEGSEFVYSHGGEQHPVTWFDLLTYGENLKGRRIIGSFEAAYPRISFPLNDRVRGSFGGYSRQVVVEEVPEVVPVPEIVVPEVVPAPVIVMPPPPEPVRPARPAGSLPEPGEIMHAVLVALQEGPVVRADLLERTGRVLGYPLAKAHAKEVPTNGVAVQRTMDRMFNILVRDELLHREKKFFSITDLAREQIGQGGLTDLKCDPILDSDPVANKPKTKKPVSSGLERRKHDELVAMWKNAVKILADPLKKRDHANAKAMIDKITLEWETRAKSETGYFKWPTTEAKGGNGQLSIFDAEKEGMLSFLEYRVGRTRGEAHGVRRIILRRVFEGSLPPVFSKDYMKQWGSNGSPERLHKMAVSIAAFARNFKRRRSSSFDDAIKDWEADLEFLRSNFYVGRFGFGWPVTTI